MSNFAHYRDLGYPASSTRYLCAMTFAACLGNNRIGWPLNFAPCRSWKRAGFFAQRSDVATNGVTHDEHKRSGLENYAHKIISALLKRASPSSPNLVPRSWCRFRDRLVQSQSVGSLFGESADRRRMDRRVGIARQLAHDARLLFPYELDARC